MDHLGSLLTPVLNLYMFVFLYFNLKTEQRSPSSRKAKTGYFSIVNAVIADDLGPRLLTLINFNPSMDK